MRWGILVVMLAWASVVAAQPEGGNAPPESFDAGLRAMERDDFVAAEMLFRRAMDEGPDDRTRLQLAQALAAQGKLREAYHLAMVVARSDDLLLVDVAAVLVGDLEGRLGWVVADADRIRPSPDRVLVDDQLAPRGVAVPVDPGAITVRAVRDGRVVALERVEVEAGTRAVVSLAPERTLTADEQTVPTPRQTALAATDETPTERPEERPSRRGLVIGLGVAGAVLIGALAVILAVTLGGGTADPTQGDVGPICLGPGGCP